MQRIGILGGTFDPIHHGHLRAALDVADALTLDAVHLIPAGQPWQKANRTITDGQLRWEMLLAAVDGNERLIPDRCELDRSGPTYTVDTLTKLTADSAADEYFLLLGADAVARLDTWREPERVFQLATIVAMTRPGHELTTSRLGDLPSEQIIEQPVTPMAISSSDLRERVAQGRSIDYLTPAAVIDVIEEARLYQVGDKA